MIIFFLTLFASLSVHVTEVTDGVILFLVDESGEVVRQMPAPSPGDYSFDDVRDGTYTLRVVAEGVTVRSIPGIDLPRPEPVEISITPEQVSQAAVASEEAGSQRNENIQVNLIDNDALIEQLGRQGANASPITEFSAVRADYAAELGGIGRNLQILRSGGADAFHGEIYGAHQNSVFNARTFFQVGSVRPSRLNRYGFSLGGPLASETLSLVIAAEETRQSGFVNGNVLVLQPDERQPRTTDPELSALIARWVATYPEELPNRTEIDPRMLNTNAIQTIRNTGGSVRLDWSVNPDANLSLRYSLGDVFIDSFELVAGQNPNQRLRPQTLNLSWQHQLSDATVLRLGTNYMRRKIHLLVPPDAVGTNVSVGRQLASLGPAFQIPVRRVQNDFEYLAHGTTSTGRHQLDWGAEVRRYQMNDFQSDGLRGIVSFGTNFGRTAVENFLRGEASRFSAVVGKMYRGFRHTDFSFFGGDRFALTPSLHLSLGLRYESAGAPSEVNDLTAFPHDADRNNFAPRVGFAYSGGKHVIRGGYGVAFGRVFPATFHWARINPPEVLKVTFQSPDLLNPFKDLVTETTQTPRSALNQLDPDLVVPYSHQYSFEIERELPASVRIKVAYFGSRTWKLFRIHRENRAVRPEGVEITTRTTNERRPDQRFFGISRMKNSARAYFDAGQFSVEKVSSNGLALRSTYTFSKAMDTGSDFSNTGITPNEVRAQTAEESVEDLKALTRFDVPHSLLVSYVYQFPGRWLRGWSISGTALFRSGTPFSVQTGTDAPPFGNADGERGDRPSILDLSLLGASIDDPDTSLQILRTDSFSTEDTFNLGRGNLARNTFRRDGVSNLNFAVARDFPLSGDRALVFRAEATNLTNHPQFSAPNSSLGSPSFGRITNTANSGRVIQFVVRLNF